jgi:hypothetical protein
MFVGSKKNMFNCVHLPVIFKGVLYLFSNLMIS